MVRDDKVDILVELTGHTANNKLGMMACRPAPVQVIVVKLFIFSIMWLFSAIAKVFIF